ncbi:restriction endonuclease subunit S [Flavobacterium sp. UBA6135]|uniref:restriction endonuclease subunit S n=1 Tax=Flavobacterium sp. UBA6135 TaxID=1946553 RepID=UPI0025BE523A|nr:restriction endonuclease subunit S [Flavobacterium sp. UBA6135]
MPKSWKTYKLTELVENIVDNRGKTCPTAETGIPLIATNCIRNEKLYPDFINIRYVSDKTYENWFRAHPQPEDLLFVLKGTPGRVCWTPNPVNFCIAQDMVALRAKKNIIYPKYLFALLRSKLAQDRINALHVGSLIPHFKKTDFDKLELPVFEDINYQKEVGDMYFDICDKIENNLAINKTLEEMAMALYKHWFVDFGPFQNGEFVESELGLIPKGWEIGKLEDLLEIKYGKDHKKLSDGLIPVYGSGGIMRYVNESLYDKESILIPRKGTLSNLFYVSQPFWSVDTMFYSKIKDIDFGKYIFYFLKTIDLASMDVGSAVPSLTTELLKRIAIIIPPKNIV